MDQADRAPLALPTIGLAEPLLILREMIRPRGRPAVSTEIRFLARLAIKNPAGLTQGDIEQLAQAMIDWATERFATDSNPSR